MDRLSSELLGFAPDARVLIVNCDDFGMHDAVNAAVVESIESGIVSSCILMVPCPAAANAMRLLRERPHISFGIHFALIRDKREYRWGPAAAKADVPSLLHPAARVWLDEGRRKARVHGKPVVDNAFLDSFSVSLHDKAATYERMLRDLRPGLTEWAVHPAHGTKEWQAIEPTGWRVRHTDHAFLTSPRAREILDQEGISIIDYRPLQEAWNA